MILDLYLKFQEKIKQAPRICDKAKKMYFTTNEMEKHEKEGKKRQQENRWGNKMQKKKDAQTEGVEINTNISIIPANENLSN